MALDITAARARATRAAKSFSPQQLLILGGLAIVSVMGLVALMRWVSQPSYSALTAGASASEIGKITDALNTAGISYKLSGNGTGVLVAQGDLANATLALSSAGIEGKGAVPGYEILDKGGITVSDFQQQVNLKRAIEGNLANTLMAMDGVDSAKVNLSIPERALFKDDQTAPRASVLIGANAKLDSSAVRAIMQTVASSVVGLTTDNVTVTDTSGQILSVAGLASGDDPMQIARKYEAATAAQVQTMLDAIFGAGKSVVRVSADMDVSDASSKEITYTTAVPVASQKTTEEFTGNNGTIPAGVAGVTGTTLGTGATNADQVYKKTDEASSVAVGSKETVTKDAPGKVKKLSVAVAVDQAAVEATGADLAVLQTLVEAAVGADKVNRGDTVVVQGQAFDTASIEAADKVTKEAESAKATSTYLGYAKTAGAIIVLLLSVLFLRKGLKSKEVEVDEVDSLTLARSAEPFGVLASADAPTVLQATVAPRSTPLAVGAADESAEERERQAADRRALDPAAEVLDLIDREPEDVASLLRSWVADRRS